LSHPTHRPILLTGVHGQVGGALLPVLRARGEVVAPTRAELDLADPEAIRAFVGRLQPSWIVNPAAYTAVDKAETEPALATAINTIAPRILGEEAARLHIPIIHFSTDYVFDGSGTRPWVETDPTGPLGVYGQTKLDGERALAASGAVHLVLRTSWVFGATGKNFLLTILRLAQQRETIAIVADQHGAPTASHELAQLVAHILRTTQQQASEQGTTPAAALDSRQGIYHASSRDETSWFGFADEFLRIAQQALPTLRLAELHPVSTAEYPTPARRPGNSRLCCDRLQSVFGFTMSDWRVATAEVMRQWLAERSGNHSAGA
jgi:dTDP-4-dehydrorhamnose reductase